MKNVFVKELDKEVLLSDLIEQAKKALFDP
jgi:hypothetical protein